MQSSAIQLDVGTLRLDFAEPSIEPGRGAHRLRIPFTYRAVPDPGDLVGRVVALTGSARDGDGMQWLGDLAPLPLYVYPDQGSQQLGLALSDHQLLSLDQSHPHDIELHLDLVASLPSQDTPPRPVSVQYRIARRQW